MIESQPLVRCRCDGIIATWHPILRCMSYSSCREECLIPAEGTIYEDKEALEKEGWISKFGAHYCSQECYDEFAVAEEEYRNRKATA